MTPAEVVRALLDARSGPERSAVLERLQPHLDEAVVLFLKQQVDQEKLRNASAALKKAELAVAIAARLEPPGARARAAWALGNALAHLTRYREALLHYQEAEVTFGPSATVLEQVALRINQVAMLEELGEYAPAIVLAEQTRPLCHTLGAAGAGPLAALEMNLGAAYEQQGALARALEAFQRGEALALSLGDPVTAARLSVNQANVLKQQDRFEQASERLRKARDTLVQNGLTQEVARVDLNLGRLAFRRGQYQAALRHLAEARAEFAAIPNPSEVAVVELHQALVYRQLNLPRETLALAQAAYQRFCQDKTRWLSALARSLEGIAWWRLGALERAAESLQDARTLWADQAPFRVLELDVERALLALDAGQPSQARTLAQSVLTHALQTRGGEELPPTLLARTRLVLARAALEEEPPNPQQAALELEEGLRLATTHDLLELQIPLEYQTGRALELHRQPERALEHYQAALEAVEKLRGLLTVEELQLGFMDDKLHIHEALAGLCLTQGQSLTQRRLLTVLETLNRAHGGPIPLLQAGQGGTDPELERELTRLREAWQWFHGSQGGTQGDPGTELSSAVEGTPRRIHRSEGAHSSPAPNFPDRPALESAIAELLRRRAVQQSTWEAQRDRTVTPNDGGHRVESGLEPDLGLEGAGRRLLARLQRVLLPGERLVHYFLVEGRLHALWVTTEQLAARALPSSLTGLRRWHRAWRLQVESGDAARGSSTLRMLLQRLHLELIQPLADVLEGAGRLFVVLPPLFHDLPLAAALAGQTYLIERHTLVHLSAPEALLAAQPLEPASWGDGPLPAWAQTHAAALVIGHSDGGRLQAAVLEARQVAQALTPCLPVIHLEEQEASLEAFRRGCERARLLHLATHATFRPDNPFFSWFRLEEARMTVAEVYELSLPERPLVVMSACETGRSEARGGGLLGLGRALLAAGASGLVVSRWQVVDSETAALMHALYAHLRSFTPSAVAVSLQQAQQQAIARGVDPRHWSAFLYMQG